MEIFEEKKHCSTNKKHAMNSKKYTEVIDTKTSHHIRLSFYKTNSGKVNYRKRVESETSYQTKFD